MNTYDKRNLAEQVEKNKQDILKHFQRDEVLADFGIRIIGQLDSPEELYRVPQDGLEYGDAYAVGTKSPFNYYIWTRANNLSPSDYWFDFGEIAIAGPQGPKGDRGEKGATGQSTTWISTFDLLNLNISNIPLDTMVLEYSSGNVYQVLTVNGIKSFSFCLNIKGPVGPKGDRGPKGDKGDTGPQGPKGATGDVGGFINIAGIVGNEYELPDPEQIQNLTVAFLVGTAEPYNLYIQVGSTSATAEWMDMGPLNVATMVTVNGVYQNTWNADTKVDKDTTNNGVNAVYGKNYAGQQKLYNVVTNPFAGGIPSYSNSDSGPVLKTSLPIVATDCANKEYVDSKAGGGWQSIKVTDASQTGSFYLPTELQGHYLNVIVTVDYHEFIDYHSRHTVMHGPTAWRVEGKNLPSLAKTIDGFSDDPEITEPSIELSGSEYGDINFSGAYIWFHAYTGSTKDYYLPEYTLWYQDLGPSFT